MKVYAIFILSIFLGLALATSCANENYNTKKVNLNLSKKGGVSNTVDRLDPNETMNINYDKELEILYINLDGIGSGYVNIVNEEGLLIESLNIDAETPISTNLPISSSNGTFSVIIDTEYIYAEGTVMP